MKGPSFRALVVAAHPDDIEFACAGTIATWTSAGADVTYGIVTDGSTGTQDPGLVGDRLVAIRQEEARRAAKAVGVHDAVFLSYPDGYVEYTLALRKDIARLFRRFRPHRFVVMDPAPTVDSRFVNHPDHRAVGQACLDIVVTAGTTPGHFPELLDEGLRPWRGLRELWIVGPGASPVVSDISGVVDRKIEALLCHESQVGDDAERIAEWIRARTAEAGRPHGIAHAETFQVLSQGPGFHGEQEWDDADLELVEPPADPGAAPLRRPQV